MFCFWNQVREGESVDFIKVTFRETCLSPLIPLPYRLVHHADGRYFESASHEQGE